MTENEKRSRKKGSSSQVPELLEDVSKLSLNNHQDKIAESKGTGAVSKKYKIRHPTDPFPNSNCDGRQKSPGPSDKKRPLSTSDSHLLSGNSPRGTTSSSSGSSPTSVSTLTPGRKKLSSFNAGSGMIQAPNIPVVLSRSSSQDMSMMGTLNEDMKTAIKSIPENTSNAKASPVGKHNKGMQRTPKKEKTFETYMMLDEVQQGLKKGELIEGVLRINPKNFQDAYISVPGERMDIYLCGIHDRNRGLNGDVVVVQLKPKEEWKILISELRNYLIRNDLDAYLTTQPNKKHIIKPRVEKTLNKIPEESSNVAAKDEIDNLKKNKKCRRKRGKKKKRVIPNSTDIAETSAASDIVDNLILLQDESESETDNLPVAKGLETIFESKIESTSLKTIPKINSSPPDNASFQNDHEVPYDTCQVLSDKITDDCSTDSATLSETQKSSTHTSFPVVDNFVSLVSMDSHNANDPAASTTTTCNGQIGSIALPVSASTHPVDNWESAAKHSQIAILQLEDLMITSHNDVVREPEFFSDVDSLEGDAVPPDELSEQDDSASDSGRSVCSNELHQPVEDEQFFVSNFTHSGNVENDVQTSNSSVVVHATNESLNDSSSNNNDNNNSTILDMQVVPSCAESPPVIAKNVPNSVLSDAHTSEKQQFLDNIYFGQPRERVLSESAGNPSLSNNLSLELKSFLSVLEQKPLENLTVEEVLMLPIGLNFIQRTAKVVYILEKKHTRLTRGNLKPMHNNNPDWAQFSPLDHRVPRIRIPMNQCPEDFLKRHTEFANTLFIARITEWENTGFAEGCLERPLGSVGEIDAETEGFLVEHGIDFGEFPKDILVDLPQHFPWTIPEEEVRCRRDFRQHCVFTIDPATARDLDDAMSCEPIGNGLYRIGVHIADVSHFLKKGSKLDQMAARRATSVYLVNTVVPMLPRQLCEELCSLNPGQDKLSFSVEWVIRDDGAILSQWFGKSIINSCVKLSYDHAQFMIENPKGTWKDGMSTVPICGKWSFEDIRNRVVWLNDIAKRLRQKRDKNGSLHLDQVKLNFQLDSGGVPLGYYVDVRKDSNRLIEEFMLLANMAVAHKIYRKYPKLAVLRFHPPPQDRGLSEVMETLQTFGIHLNCEWSGDLQKSLNNYLGNDELSYARHLVITMMLARPMKRAMYCCSGFTSDEAQFWHYALSVPLYTHFTSPIRRYPDVLVHRLLAASIDSVAGGCPSGHDKDLGTPKEIDVLARHCNDKKTAAKQVQELSSELYLGAFIRKCGPLEEEAMVCSVMDHSFDVLLLKMGIVKRIYCEHLPELTSMEFVSKEGSPRLLLVFTDPQGDSRQAVISIFTRVVVILSSKKDDPLHFKASFKCLM